MLEWWMDQSPAVRYGLSLLLMGVGAVLFLLGIRRGVFPFALGLALLLVSGPSSAEKKGYRF